MFCKRLSRFFLVFLWVLFASILSGGPSLEGAGKLVIAGGGISSSHREIWELILAERLEGRPIGIISTASADPEERGAPYAASLNEEWGEGTAVFIPLSEDNNKAEDAEVAELIRQCGGFFFTGGQQSRTARALLRENGEMTPALKALWKVYRQGGVIGGSSAGAAIMSDPMISSGNSANALLHGATPLGTPSEERGVTFRRGLGFHPGVLYCQHHLERGRFGRLLAALVSENLAFETGVGVAEDTAFVVDHSRNTGKVIGAKGVLFVDSSRAMTWEDGRITGVRLHYLDRGDAIHFPTGRILPAPGKTPAPPTLEGAPPEIPDAWSRDAIWHLLTDLAQRKDPVAAKALDPRFALFFRRTEETGAWRQPGEDEETRPTWTVTNIEVAVIPRETSSN